MAIRKECKTVDNGNEIHIIYYQYDDEKPKCWIEGFEYRFNVEVIFTEIVKKSQERK